mmetsp:Transcript_5685/g.24069  ORF Transcript_5685/g.24069 Transcript_5685/m.24069 type:complete len:163 (-) Transcript_5685:28-516(-)
MGLCGSQQRVYEGGGGRPLPPVRYSNGPQYPPRPADRRNAAAPADRHASAGRYGGERHAGHDRGRASAERGGGNARAASSGPRTISPQELAKHASMASAWIAVGGKVYDITSWIHSHPGGAAALQPYLGKDGTSAAQSAHSYLNVHASLARFCVGRLDAGHL